MKVPPEKGIALLRFLKDVATLRRKRVPAYGSRDKLLWFADVPKDRTECRSPLLKATPGELVDIWLEVRKKPMPIRPPIPEVVSDWVRAEELDQAVSEPELLREITILVDREVPDPEAPPEQPRTVVERVPEVRQLEDHPEVQDAWHPYLRMRWQPWAKELLRWQEVQQVYDSVDFMRRRLEESEERYELLIAVGLLQWRDSTGASVKRHLLTAPAEIELDASRGVLRVLPAASFESFKIELDMLELRDQPRFRGAEFDDALENLDIQVWDTMQIGDILRRIANSIRSDSQVHDKAFAPAERAEETLRALYAPALVLRERRPTSYEELVGRLLEAKDDAPQTAATQPWGRFVSEGESFANFADVTYEHTESDRKSLPEPERLLFPLPTNDEQRQIATRLRAKPYVLVKGPPGTGKSLTIANLICHLLASGERLLVTAHAAKALIVLRRLLPADIRNLCVTALGSSREDHDVLKDGVRGIIHRRNEWIGAKATEAKIAALEHELLQLEEKRVQTDRRLRESREAESYPHRLPGGYEGTAARISRQLEQERETCKWIPEVSDDQTPFPLESEDVQLLTAVLSQLNQDRRKELQMETGDFALPEPDDFRGIVAEYETAVKIAEGAASGVTRQKLDALRTRPAELLEESKAFLTALEQHTMRAERLLGELGGEIATDLLVGQKERWERLASQITSTLKSALSFGEQIGTARLGLPSDVDSEKLRTDAEKRLQHFEGAGRRGFSIFAPRVVRETRYIEDCCRVDGHAPREIESLAKLLAFINLISSLEDFARLWPVPFSTENEDPRRALAAANELTQELEHFLSFFDQLTPSELACFPITERIKLANRDDRAGWLGAIEAQLALLRVQSLQTGIDGYAQAINRCLASSACHPCIHQLSDALEKRDTVEWQRAWEVREHLLIEKERLRRYEILLTTLDDACPGLRNILLASEGIPECKPRLDLLEKAWAWSAARVWIRRISNASDYLDQVNTAHRTQARIEKKTEELATLLAWRSFFGRLDDSTIQNLSAWAKAVDRMGKGTGKYAYRHRRTARKYLVDCIPKIPAWIMPLHKLWSTVDPQSGLFDTVIVDEASQAGVESLALLLLAKRIIVVGDDKQNSPEAVGVLEDDIARLARQHLSQFRFRDEFRPDTSLFDHAERAFGNLITLREHFRCVPEIIRFSNDLCYRDAPLIPLRQAPPNRVPPLESRYVPTGACEGKGARIHNRAEAEALVATIESRLADPAYEGKTMGVIALQGHAQADLIGNMLAQKLDPKVIDERRLRCGVPATFQGDERDIIFLSLVIAPNVEYRALNRLPEQRRFNVAMSRAKDQILLFHSVRQHDLSKDCLRRRLLNFFESPGHEAMMRQSEALERLEREARKSPRRHGDQPDPYDSWFEVDVALELLRRRYAIRPQYEVAGKYIDIVVEGPDAQMAVECDGDEWHGPDQYEEDMLRERRLVRAGWTFVRIRESEFYADRDGAVHQILEGCESLGIWPVDHLDEAIEREPLRAPPQEENLVAQPGEVVVEEHIEDTETDDSADIESGPFTGYSASSGFPDPREASPANVRTALHYIIEKDGPLPRASVYRLYVEGCADLQRVGRMVRQALNRALGAMLRSGDLLQENELGENSPEAQIVRLSDTPKVRERPVGRRDLLEIPPSEIHVVLDRLRPPDSRTEEADETLLRNLMEHYGFGRLTGGRKKFLIKVIEKFRHKEGERGDTGITPRGEKAIVRQLIPTGSSLTEIHSVQREEEHRLERSNRPKVPQAPLDACPICGSELRYSHESNCWACTSRPACNFRI